MALQSESICVTSSAIITMRLLCFLLSIMFSRPISKSTSLTRSFLASAGRRPQQYISFTIAGITYCRTGKPPLGFKWSKTSQIVRMSSSV